MKRTPLRRVSRKERAVHRPAFDSVKSRIATRSYGQCEIRLSHRTVRGLDEGIRARFLVPTPWEPGMWRCAGLFQDGHHTLKPRRAHNTPDAVIGVCRLCHEWCDKPYNHPQGRLCITPLGNETFRTEVVYKQSKWSE